LAESGREKPLICRKIGNEALKFGRNRTMVENPCLAGLGRVLRERKNYGCITNRTKKYANDPNKEKGQSSRRNAGQNEKG